MSADNGTGFIVDIVRATTRGSLVPIPPKEPPKKNQSKVEDPRDSALWLAENELMKVRILFSDSVPVNERKNNRSHRSYEYQFKKSAEFC